MQTFLEFYNNSTVKRPSNTPPSSNNTSSALDKLQAALDIAGFEPTVGTGADALNATISGLRAAHAKEPDERKKHLLNAGISAVSMIPFADAIKVLKLRKLGKPAVKMATSGARAIKNYANIQKRTGDRFAQTTLNV